MFFSNLIVLAIGALVCLAISVAFLSLLDYLLGDRLSVYSAIEYLLCPTEEVEGKIEEIQLARVETWRLLFSRFSYTANVYKIKLDTSPNQFLVKGLSNENSKDDPKLYYLGRRMKIIFHRNIVPWQNKEMPFVTDRDKMLYD